MRKGFIFIVFLYISITIFADTVSKDKAITIGANFIYGNERKTLNTEFWGESQEEGIYIINFAPSGWALISSNSDARPVIGYSETGYFDINNLNKNTIDWLDIQKKQISNASGSQLWENEWKTLEEGKLPISKSSNSVAPLLKTTWNQSAGWNRFCPEFSGGPGGKAYVGCVAVSMAQALHNIKYPSRAEGAKSYTLDSYGTVAIDFDAEPSYQWELMSFDESDDYNAQLLFNCAVAVEMNFSSDGSGAYTYRVPSALQKHFGFSGAVKNYNRFSDEDQWVNLLKEDLKKGNVIIYAGNADDGNSGHAFNIDGYKTNGYFHFNWGWSGSMNGYFSINDVAPGKSDFTKNQSAVVGISVPDWGPVDIVLSNNTINIGSSIGTIVGDISVTDYSEDDEFTFEIFGAPLFMQEGYAPAKFYIEDSKLKLKESLSNSNGTETATIIASDSDNNSFEKSFEIIVNQSSQLITTPAVSPSFFPNPASDVITLKNESYRSYQIYDLNGKIAQEGKIKSKEINLSLTSGTYILKLRSENTQSVSKLIIHE